MKFRTEIKLNKANFNITHKNSILGIGSCFVENIGFKLKLLNFNLNINPYGIIFNPYSIAKILNNSLPSPIKLQSEGVVISSSNGFKSFDYHSKFNAKTYNDFIDKVNLTQNKVKTNLKTADYLFLTFGTAWVYKLIDTQQIVANCLKEPQTNFTKELLDLNELIDIYTKIINKIIEINPKQKIMLTVSPVRHVKDGLLENNQSKSVLLLLCKALSDGFKQNVIYFPAYEIQVDDLRDYRFYNSDLVHPNEMAIEYIFDKFSNTFFNENTKDLCVKINKLNKLKKHKFINATKNEIEKQQLKILSLEKEINIQYQG